MSPQASLWSISLISNLSGRAPGTPMVPLLGWSCYKKGAEPMSHEELTIRLPSSMAYASRFLSYLISFDDRLCYGNTSQLNLPPSKLPQLWCFLTAKVTLVKTAGEFPSNHPVSNCGRINSYVYLTRISQDVISGLQGPSQVPLNYQKCLFTLMRTSMSKNKIY